MASHHERRFANPGHPPTKWPEDTQLGIRFANGREARHTYTAKQLTWTIRGWNFDIAEFWRA